MTTSATPQIRISGDGIEAGATVFGSDGGYYAEASDLGLRPGRFPKVVFLAWPNGVTLACDLGVVARENGALRYFGRDQRTLVTLFND